MDIENVLTLLAIFSSILFSLISIGLTLYFERERQKERFADSKGELTAYFKQVGSSGIIFIENTGKSTLILESVEWLDNTIYTKDVSPILLDGDLPLFEKSIGNTFVPGKRQKLYIRSDDVWCSPLRDGGVESKKSRNVKFTFKTLSKTCESVSTFRFWGDSMTSGPTNYVNNIDVVKEIKSLKENLVQVVSELIDTIE